MCLERARRASMGAEVDLWEGRQERERREGGGGEEWGRGCGRVHERGMYTGHATGGERVLGPRNV